MRVVPFLSTAYTNSMAFFSLSQIVRISRPRFWIYLLGPYLLGVLSAHPTLKNVHFMAFLLAFFFTVPANFFLYGINDLFDYETDKLNPKKQGYETLMKPDAHSAMRWGAVCVAALLLLFMIWIPFWASVLCLFFLFLSYFYSAPPIRAKARPVLDSAFNVLYLIPGLIGFLSFGNAQIHWPAMIGAGLWCMAMHAYSAVPDILSDKQAHLRTIATLLEKNVTLFLCAIFYATAAALTWNAIGFVSLIGGSVYVALMIITATQKTPSDQLTVYRIFPWVNTAMGAIIFFSLLLHR